jgi:hypothetical protein
MTVDSPEFRSKVFDYEWFGAKLEYRLEFFSRFLGFGLGIHGEFAAVLDREVEHWREIGVRIGYLAETADVTSISHASFDERMFFCGPYEKDVFGKPLEPDHATFARAMGEARDELTPARVQFLELLMFASDRRWEQELREVRRIAELTVRRPWVQLPRSSIDGIAWSLRGAERTTTAPDWSPAAWRTQTLWRVDPEGPRLSQMVYDRVATLTEAREPIRRACEWLLEDDTTPPPVRFAAEELGGREFGWIRREGSARDE